MTLAFIARAGDGGVGDPPSAWLMPLLGDAAVGVTAPIVAYMLWSRRRPSSWLIGVAWGAIAVFDAVAAFVVQRSVPWNEFFMIELLGESMFFAAAAMHLVAMWLLLDSKVAAMFDLNLSPNVA